MKLLGFHTYENLARSCDMFGTKICLINYYFIRISVSVHVATN